MVKKCIICKEEQKASESRSFHKFPTDDALKIQWMHAAGLLSISKGSTICSDHFDNSSFDNRGGLHGCPIRRRLLKNAIPKEKISQDPNVLMDVSNNLNSKPCSNHNATVTDDENKLKTYDVSNTVENIHYTNDCNSTTEKHNFGNDNQLCANTKNTSDCPKRKLGPADDPQPKKMRFTSGFKTEYFSRDDCISDESWARFLRFNKYKNRLLKSAHNKNTEKQKKILNMKGLVKDLKEKQLFSAAQYLQVCDSD